MGCGAAHDRMRQEGMATIAGAAHDVRELREDGHVGRLGPGGQRVRVGRGGRQRRAAGEHGLDRVVGEARGLVLRALFRGGVDEVQARHLLAGEDIGKGDQGVDEAVAVPVT